MGTDVTWSESNKRWTFPSGAKLSFGHLENEDDKYEYQGSEYHCIGVDELTHLTKTQYEYLFSRLRRRKGSTIPIRMRATSNPGGAGHEWVKQKFMVEAKPGRLFIPAGLIDNPHLDQDEYVKSLGELDPVTRAQLLNGDWSVRNQGNMFRREWYELVDDVKDMEREVRFWDMASTEAKKGKDPDYTVGVKLGVRKNSVYVLDVRRVRLNPGEARALVKQTAQLDGKGCLIYQEQEGGSSGKIVTDTYARDLMGYSFRGIPSTGDKVVRAHPVSASSFNRHIKILNAPWTGDFLSELEQFPGAAHDDQVDAFSGAFNALNTSSEDRFLVMSTGRMNA
jgi:predicted phage terminase large subunit-like protein